MKWHVTLWTFLSCLEDTFNLASQPYQGDRWVNIGPAPIANGVPPASGRVGQIGVDPSALDHWLIASDTGGVWET